MISPEEIRKSLVYARALESARVGDSIAVTTETLLSFPLIRNQVNKGKRDWLVTLALAVQQAHIDVSPIQVELTTFEE